MTARIDKSVAYLANRARKLSRLIGRGRDAAPPNRSQSKQASSRRDPPIVYPDAVICAGGIDGHIDLLRNDRIKGARPKQGQVNQLPGTRRAQNQKSRQHNYREVFGKIESIVLQPITAGIGNQVLVGENVVTVKKHPKEQEKQKTESCLMEPPARGFKVRADGQSAHQGDGVEEKRGITNGLIGNSRMKPELIINPKPLIEGPCCHTEAEEDPKGPVTTETSYRVQTGNAGRDQNYYEEADVAVGREFIALAEG